MAGTPIKRARTLSWTKKNLPPSWLPYVEDKETEDGRQVREIISFEYVSSQGEKRSKNT